MRFLFQKFKDELKKNREKALNTQEESSSTRKEVEIFFFILSFCACSFAVRSFIHSPLQSLICLYFVFVVFSCYFSFILLIFLFLVCSCVPSFFFLFRLFIKCCLFHLCIHSFFIDRFFSFIHISMYPFICLSIY